MLIQSIGVRYNGRYNGRVITNRRIFHGHSRDRLPAAEHAVMRLFITALACAYGA